MKTAIAISLLVGAAALAAVRFPYVGVIGYYGYVVLGPEWTLVSWKPPISFQKIFAAAICAGIGLFGWKGQRLTAAGRCACLSLTGYLIVATTSAYYSQFPDKSWWYMDFFWKIWLAALVGCKLLNAPNKIFATIWTIVLAQGYNAFEINREYFQLGFTSAKIDGRNELDNNTYILSTLVPMAFAAALAIHESKWWRRGLAGAIFAMQLHQVLLLETRGGLLAVLLMFVLGLIFMPKRSDTVFGAILIATLGVLLAGRSVLDRYKTIFDTEDQRDASASSRYELWSAGQRIMADYPLLGVGTFAGERVVPFYTSFTEDKDKALHNLFFDVGAGSGVIALTFYVLFFFLPWWALVRLWRRNHLTGWAGAASLGVLTGVPSYWCGSMFSSSALIESPYIAVSLGVAALAVVARLLAEDLEPPAPLLSVDSPLTGSP